MKTRNTSIVSVKENNKIKNVSKSKKTKIIKPKETVKDASYRDLHNIGRRKSTSSVVTYSLDSRLFFDVYAKFNNENLPKERNIYNSMYTNTKKSQATVPTKRRMPTQDIHSSSYSEIDSTNDLESPKNVSKVAKASYEAKPIRHDEACIPSPKIPATSPIRPRSTDHRVISSRNLRPTSSNIVTTPNEIKDAKSLTTGSKSQTFQRLLDNKTVFKKHLSQKQQKSTTRITSDRRLSTRLNKSLPAFLESTEHECEINGKKKLERQSEPRGKRIASLNAAAIINCVQNLFDDSTGQGDNKRRSVRRRVSKSAVGNLSVNSTEKPNKVEADNLENRENLNSSPLTLVIETNNESAIKRDGSQASSRADGICIHSDKSGSLKSSEQINNVQLNKTKFPVVQSVTKKPITNGPNQAMIVVKSQKKKNSIPQFFDITATVSNGKQKDRFYHLSNKRPKILSGSTTLAISTKSVIAAPTTSKKSIIKEDSVISNAKEILIDSSKNQGGFSQSSKKKKKQTLPSKVVEPLDQGDQNGESLWQWEGEPFQKLIQIQLAGSMVERTCYHSIRHSRDDIVIRIMDCVMLRSNTDDQEPFLAKVTMFYLDDETGKKMMSMLWYYRPEHTEQGRLPWHTDSDVYASRHLDNNSIDCIEDKAFVLPVELYSRFMAYQKRQSAGSRPSLAARLIPVNGEDSIISDSDENKPNTVIGDSCADIFISSFYYTINFQNSFPAEMTSSNVFVCRGLYDINQHKITRNILQAIQSPKLDSVEACESIDSAMSISSCDTEPKQEVSNSQTVLKTPLSKIPVPPVTTIGSISNNCLPPISSFQNCVSNKSQEESTPTVSTVITTRIATTTTTTVPATKSCPLPPPSKPVQPPLPLSSIANDIVAATFFKQPNGHA